MKRVTREEIQRAIVRAESLAHRRVRKHSNRKHSFGTMRVFSRLKIIAPDNLDLFNTQNYIEFILFLTTVRDALDKGEKILIDFKNTISLKACAVVVLYAHIDFFQRDANNIDIIKVTLSKNKRLNSWLRDSGIWKLTSFNSGNGNDESALHIVSAVAGSNVKERINNESKDKIRKILKFVREKIYGGKISGEEAQKLYAAITESISNVGLHAYSDIEMFKDFIELIGKRWWILARQVEDQLFLVIYDMGEGIPRTLVKRSFFEALIERLFDPKTDAEKILAAVQYGETRMKSDKHGKGLHDIKTFVVDNPMGELHIFSGMGKYTFTSSTGEETKNDLKYSVGGTLIQWNISLKARP
ncbi:hypothetical protein ASE93_11850 [Serratia sp. Leaf50]|nr:hypothetical protein ASE93_11850 [Serratia sp. Leaf50]